jgi:hypothetical protein
MTTEEESSWTGVTLAYLCPYCGARGDQLFLVSGIGWDMKRARLAAWPEMAPCIQCKQALPPDSHTGIDLVVAPLDQLRKLGFPSPLVN